MKRITIVLGAAVFAASGLSQVIVDRTELESLMNGQGTLEDFESYAVNTNNSAKLEIAWLDHTTIVNSFGPGLVEPGAVYYSVYPNGQPSVYWNGDQYHGLDTRAIETQGFMRIGYTEDVNMFGVDLRSFRNYGYDGTVRVYREEQLLYEHDFALSSSNGSSVFFGYRDAEGITHVELYDHDHTWSPIIDNHAYAVGVVPEPRFAAFGLALLLVATARRRR